MQCGDGSEMHGVWTSGERGVRSSTTNRCDTVESGQANWLRRSHVNRRIRSAASSNYNAPWSPRRAQARSPFCVCQQTAWLMSLNRVFLSFFWMMIEIATKIHVFFRLAMHLQLHVHFRDVFSQRPFNFLFKLFFSNICNYWLFLFRCFYSCPTESNRNAPAFFMVGLRNRCHQWWQWWCVQSTQLHLLLFPQLAVNLCSDYPNLFWYFGHVFVWRPSFPIPSTLQCYAGTVLHTPCCGPAYVRFSTLTLLSSSSKILPTI